MHTASRIRSRTFPVTVQPTKADIALARSVARDTPPVPEEVARALTWGADEKILLVLAAVGWLGSRGCGEPLRRAGNQAIDAVRTSLITIAGTTACGGRG
jgi:hypothetical protein